MAPSAVYFRGLTGSIAKATVSPWDTLDCPLTPLVPGKHSGAQQAERELQGLDIDALAIGLISGRSFSVQNRQ
jgi:hypothetical protein